MNRRAVSRETQDHRASEGSGPKAARLCGGIGSHAGEDRRRQNRVLSEVPGGIHSQGDFMNENKVLMLLKRELYELMGALSIQEIMGNARLIAELNNALKLLGQ
jgi:hypothetical protein